MVGNSQLQRTAEMSAALQHLDLVAKVGFGPFVTDRPS